MRYQELWNVSEVFAFLCKRSLASKLSLKQLAPGMHALGLDIDTEDPISSSVVTTVTYGMVIKDNYAYF